MSEKYIVVSHNIIFGPDTEIFSDLEKAKQYAQNIKSNDNSVYITKVIAELKDNEVYN